ncbi:double zinc ribbon domain-containing protein, partial [Bradyrhizobium algeriense]|uniref:double zinc ribbon domain-containing protein n=1 Tax=Bradyrhizobium algeriense TaxID=634784 RepID=UPI00167F1673
MECPSCGSANPDGHDICRDCGRPLSVRCAACGSENPSGKRFCGDCGAPLMPIGAARVSVAAGRAVCSVPRVSEPLIFPPAPSSSAERRQLTVMFCDLVGSTALAAQLDPEDLRETIAAYRDGVAAIVRKYGGTISRYIGDGMLILFGH